MSQNNFKAIPTSYSGINFRSRLEAKWAAFFHLLGWEYEYEPIDLDGYIPDFVLVGSKTPIYVEVKPALTMRELREMCEKARRATIGKKLLCLGATIGYHEDPLCVPGMIGSMVSRINLCDREMLDMYASWFGDGNSNSEEWDQEDPSTQQCIIGFHEECELRMCNDILCQRLSPRSIGYSKTCAFCGTLFQDRWGWEDHKNNWDLAKNAWKEAGNIIQYRFAKS